MASEPNGLLALIEQQLKDQGIDLDKLRTDCVSNSSVKVVCVAPDMKASVRELSEGPRDQVVMVRIDEKTRKSLDDWIETGAVRSRSEGAALFIREGLKVRADELDQLRKALTDVRVAKEELRRQASKIIGTGEDPDKDQQPK
jgi:Arc/MetJ-type ribon-helix-helix transcriptional regulator